MAALPFFSRSKLGRFRPLQATWALAACAWIAAVAAWRWPVFPLSGQPRWSLVLHFLIYFPLCAPAVGAVLALTGLPEERVPPSRNIERIGRLDHLRFFAAALVVLYHYFDQAVPFDAGSRNLLFNVMTEGRLGVDIFFVLSGFVFGLIGYGRKIRYLDFLWARVIRIYPLYLLALLLVLATHAGKYAPLDPVLLLAPFLYPGFIFTLPGFTQLWTIGLEFQFYLLFPFLAAFLLRNGYKYLGAILVGAIALRAFYYGELGTVRDLSYATMPGRIDLFVAGIGGAWCYLNRRAWFSHPVHLLLAGCVAAAFFQALLVWDGRGGDPASMLWIVWPLLDGVVWSYLILSYLSCRVPLPAFLDESLAKLGAMSFSLYVTHDFAVVWTLKYGATLGLTHDARTDAALKGVFLCLPLSLLLAWGTYHLIEKQFFIYRRKYVEPTKASPPRVA